MTSILDTVRNHRLPPPKVAQAIRRAAGVTQQQLADALGVHVITVGRWEAGTRTPRGELRDRYREVVEELRAFVEGDDK
jgi:HTH-type transcriptional regulator/antitoxin MqsA